MMVKQVGLINYRVWLFTWMEFTNKSFATFEEAHDYARASGEAWRIVRLSDDVGVAESTMPIRKPESKGEADGQKSAFITKFITSVNRSFE